MPLLSFKKREGNHTAANQGTKTPGPTKRESNLNNNAISDSTSEHREEDWPTDDSFIIEPNFQTLFRTTYLRNIRAKRLLEQLTTSMD